MKKLIAILLILCFITVFAACGKNEEDDGKAFETAETYVEITGEAGSISLDENVAISLLEIYGKESLGLKKDIYEYELKLSPTRFMEEDACLVEAFDGDSEKPEGTFIILGQQSFVYNQKRQEYLLLTVDGPVEYATPSESKENSSTTAPAFEYDEGNNTKLQEKFSSYSKKQLRIEKELSEYILVVSGITTTVEKDETVYIIRVYEKTGKMTNYTLAFNENGNYVYDGEANQYVKL